GDPRDIHAPRWVVGAAGLAFVLAGIAVATGPADGRPTAASAPATWRSGLLSGAIVGLMAVAPNWIAFGPGERRFGGMLGGPFPAAPPAVGGERDGGSRRLRDRRGAPQRGLRVDRGPRDSRPAGAPVRGPALTDDASAAQTPVPNPPALRTVLASPM